MEISVSEQAYVFLGMVLCGAVCSLAFDVFRGLRKTKKPGAGVIVMQDLLLWLLEIIIVYVTAFKLNYAGIRAYELVALVIGSVIYFMTLSSLVIRCVSAIFGFLIRVVNIIISPVKKLLLLMLKPFAFLFKIAAGAITKLINSFKAFLTRLKLRIRKELSTRFKKKPKDKTTTPDTPMLNENIQYNE